MAARRPFATEHELFAAAAATWQALTRNDWLEAFAAHPRIGDLNSLRAGYDRGLAASEQAGVAHVSESVLQALSDGNRAYEAKFGHIFIVCATGKSAAEMLAMLQERLSNDPDQELLLAAAEQQKITHLRLQKVCP
jgi:2-oxo-4-hydroxy-4-carboxy-5-ureidoimidazoline decarboxylase